ncbi:NADH dehydrogenase (ubiquinone) MWFE subunit [Arctopsyche grandis]|uniref:NADH dehydrogenase (ubiquinone) MWFE subunit n=1 Tax=Arctopsyche grandis TaxID=121162 RepID=UPI00406DA1E1
MWFEIIPPGLIIVGALFLPAAVMNVMHSTVIKTPYRRHIHDTWDRMLYLRDERVGDGNVYTVKGLQSIPDEK